MSISNFPQQIFASQFSHTAALFPQVHHIGGCPVLNTQTLVLETQPNYFPQKHFYKHVIGLIILGMFFIFQIFACTVLLQFSILIHDRILSNYENN